MLEFFCTIVVNLVTDLDRREGIKKANDYTYGKPERKGKCGVEQGKVCNGSKGILFVLWIDIFQFHLVFDVVQSYSHWANFSINIQL